MLVFQLTKIDKNFNKQKMPYNYSSVISKAPFSEKAPK